MPKLGFAPARDGYHFPNNFENRLLPGTPVQITTTGLCGGMSLSALDYWRAGVPIPTHTTADYRGDVPPEGSRLRDYIYARQLDTFLIKATITRWVTAPWIGPQDFHNWAVGSEFEVVRREIDAGRPCVLGLWAMPDQQHHQILCYGYDYWPHRLYVYDPNRPDQEVVLQPISPDAGMAMTAAGDPSPYTYYRGYFWADVVSWSEPPRFPPYYDIGVQAGLMVSPAGSNVPLGGRLQASVTVANFGEHPAHFRNLYIWVRGPGGENLDGLLGGAEQGLTVLNPGDQRLINRTSQSFGDREGPYVIGVSYLSQQNNWHNITAGAPGTTMAQQVVLRRTTTVVADTWVEVRESDYDVDSGIVLQPGDEYALAATGHIWAGVWFTGENGPEGWTDRIETNPRSPLHDQPNAHPFSLVARLDGFPYFYVGASLPRQRYNGGGARRLYLRINDDTPGNGSGAFNCHIQVWR